MKEHGSPEFQMPPPPAPKRTRSVGAIVAGLALLAALGLGAAYEWNVHRQLEIEADRRLAKEEAAKINAQINPGDITASYIDFEPKSNYGKALKRYWQDSMRVVADYRVSMKSWSPIPEMFEPQRLASAAGIAKSQEQLDRFIEGYRAYETGKMRARAPLAEETMQTFGSFIPSQQVAAQRPEQPGLTTAKLEENMGQLLDLAKREKPKLVQGKLVWPTPTDERDFQRLEIQVRQGYARFQAATREEAQRMATNVRRY